MRALLYFLALWTSVNAYNILCVVPTPTQSHNILGKGLIDILLNAGHNVTWVTAFPPKKPSSDRLRIVDVSFLTGLMEGFDKQVMKENSVLKTMSSIMEKLREMGRQVLTEDLKKVLVEQQFDAVITEFLTNDFDSGYAAVQQVPWIILNPTTLLPNLQGLLDEAHSVPTVPMMFTDFNVPMNFWQRLVTSGIYGLMLFGNWWGSSVSKALYHEMFGTLAAARGVTLPSFEDARTDVSIVFINSHPSLSAPVSMAPNFIDVAGYHIDENVAPLPKDLQDLLDSSTQGFIYFSMGTIIQSKNFPEETRRKVLKMFSKLPYTVLWKFEEEMKDLPKNVHVRKWMPQSSILAHKNIKVFITHGGMLSNLEAITHGVPLVTVPMTGDQPANAQRAARLGYAVKVTFDAESLADKLKQGLDEVLGNDRYYNRAQELSSLFRDRPVAPSKLVLHYVELAIKSKGAYHLRSKSPLYSWYQRAMIDQAAFLVVIFTALYFILKILVKFILNKVLGRKKVKTN